MIKEIKSKNGKLFKKPIKALLITDEESFRKKYEFLINRKERAISM